MYFQISQDRNYNFPEFYKINKFSLSTDMGWTEIQGSFGKIIYKGYAYIDLEQFLKTYDPETVHNYHGSFTAIMEKNNKIYIIHDTSREYPIFIDKKITTITNLQRSNDTQYPDVSIHLDCDSNEICESHHEFKFSKGTDVNLNDTADTILNLINNDIQSFNNRYKNPIKVVPTGGIDSTLLIAVLKYNNVDFEVIDYEYKKWTYFYKKNRNTVTNNINEGVFINVGHTWGEVPTTLANGWHADQQFFRCYLPLAVFCKYKSIDFISQLEKNKNTYSYQFLKKEIVDRQSQLSKVLDRISNTDLAYKRIFEIIRASFQPWSFEKTIYWSPFKNLEITKNVLQMSCC